MKLLRGIADGINDPVKLLALMDTGKLKAGKEDLLKSLVGVYKEQLATIPKHQLSAFDFYRQQMKVYETCIEAVLHKLMLPDTAGKPVTIPARKGVVGKNQYSRQSKRLPTANNRHRPYSHSGIRRG